MRHLRFYPLFALIVFGTSFKALGVSGENTLIDLLTSEVLVEISELGPTYINDFNGFRGNLVNEVNRVMNGLTGRSSELSELIKTYVKNLPEEVTQTFTAIDNSRLVTREANLYHQIKGDVVKNAFEKINQLIGAGADDVFKSLHPDDFSKGIKAIKESWQRFLKSSQKVAAKYDDAVESLYKVFRDEHVVKAIGDLAEKSQQKFGQSIFKIAPSKVISLGKAFSASTLKRGLGSFLIKFL